MNEITTISSFGKLIESKLPAIASRLPSHIDAKRMAKVIVTCAAKNPAILRCTPDSVLMATFQACELGLEPGSALGEAYLIPYGQTCQFVPGYRGLISLARRSGQIKSIEAVAVIRGDRFTYERGLSPRLEHFPDLERSEMPKTEDLLAVYAIANLVEGGTQFEVMLRHEIDAIRARSKSARSGPWVTDYFEMAKKTAIRRLSKSLPLSVEMARAIEVQAQAEAGEFEEDLNDITAAAERIEDLNRRAQDAAGDRGEGAKV